MLHRTKLTFVQLSRPFLITSEIQRHIQLVFVHIMPLITVAGESSPLAKQVNSELNYQ